MKVEFFYIEKKQIENQHIKNINTSINISISISTNKNIKKIAPILTDGRNSLV